MVVVTGSRPCVLPTPDTLPVGHGCVSTVCRRIVWTLRRFLCSDFFFKSNCILLQLSAAIPFQKHQPEYINLNENSTEVSFGIRCATRKVLTVHCVRYIQNIGKQYNIPIRNGKSINGLNLIIRQATHKTAIVKALESSTNVLPIISYLY